MRRRMKCGGKPRRKAGFGVDGALIAGATLAAAGMNVLATTQAAKQQADATVKNAEHQTRAIEEQSKNDTQLQKDMISYQTEQKQQDRDLLNDINMTMQMQAGKQNANDIMNANRMQAKYGKTNSKINSKRRKLRTTQPSYGGATKLVQTTDGGEAVPLAIDENGYGVYELRGDNHKQYHKAQGGKYKSGVGVKTRTGEVVEGEGSKTNKPGELYVRTPNNDYFLSRHTINGFNPTDAVLSGMNPDEALAIQETNKDILDLPDDGHKAKISKRMHKLRYGGRNKYWNGGTPYNFYGPYLNTDNPWQGSVPITGMNLSAPNTTANPTFPRSLPTKAPNYNTGGTRSGAGNYTGAIVGAGANILGAGLSWLGNYLSGRTIAAANEKAYSTLADAYKNLKTIDMDIIDGNESWNAPQVLAVVRDPNVSDKPMIERVNRDARHEKDVVNRSTMSSAARINRLANIDDNRQQRISEIAANTNNKREDIIQKNIDTINNMAVANADRTMKWRSDKTKERLQLAMYNNNIKNLQETGPAQARADADLAIAQAKSDANLVGWSGLASAITGSAQGFASTWSGLRQEHNNWNNVLVGANLENQIAASITRDDSIGIQTALNLYNTLKRNTDTDSIRYTQMLRNHLKSKGVAV